MLFDFRKPSTGEESLWHFPSIQCKKKTQKLTVLEKKFSLVTKHPLLVNAKFHNFYHQSGKDLPDLTTCLEKVGVQRTSQMYGTHQMRHEAQHI